jgi:histidine triad (HIT) family protein
MVDLNRETIFTKIVAGEIPCSKVYEDDDHLAFLDITPFEKGHTLVIPKKPYETIMDMPEEAYLDLMRVVRNLAIHFEKLLGCGVNVWQNNGHLAGQEVPHVHFHVVPRLVVKDAYVKENKPDYVEGEMNKYAEKLKL